MTIKNIDAVRDIPQHIIAIRVESYSVGHDGVPHMRRTISRHSNRGGVTVTEFSHGGEAIAPRREDGQELSKRTVVVYREAGRTEEILDYGPARDENGYWPQYDAANDLVLTVQWRGWDGEAQFRTITTVKHGKLQSVKHFMFRPSESDGPGAWVEHRYDWIAEPGDLAQRIARDPSTAAPDREILSTLMPPDEAEEMIDEYRSEIAPAVAREGVDCTDQPRYYCYDADDVRHVLDGRTIWQAMESIGDLMQRGLRLGDPDIAIYKAVPGNETQVATCSADVFSQ